MKEVAIFLESATFKKIYFVIFLVLLLLGMYIVIDPEPFLKLGYLGVFIFNFLGGLGSYLIPSLSQKMDLISLSFATALGMVLNDTISFVAGRGSTAIIQKGEWINRAEKLINRFGSPALFVISALPVPYDAIGLISGYLGVKYRNFFLATFAGKFLRMILIGIGTKQLIKLF